VSFLSGWWAAKNLFTKKNMGLLACLKPMHILIITEKESQLWLKIVMAPAPGRGTGLPEDG